MLTCNSVDKIGKHDFPFYVIEYFVYERESFVNRKCSHGKSELKTSTPALGTDRSRVPASYATKSYLDA